MNTVEPGMYLTPLCLFTAQHTHCILQGKVYGSSVEVKARLDEGAGDEPCEPSVRESHKVSI